VSKIRNKFDRKREKLSKAGEPGTRQKLGESSSSTVTRERPFLALFLFWRWAEEERKN
jgi:hypothetical protein